MSSDSRRLDSLPPPSQAALLTVVAAFLPYYAQPQARPGNHCHEVPVMHLVAGSKRACSLLCYDRDSAFPQAVKSKQAREELFLRDAACSLMQLFQSAVFLSSGSSILGHESRQRFGWNLYASEKSQSLLISTGIPPVMIPWSKGGDAQEIFFVMV